MQQKSSIRLSYSHMWISIPRISDPRGNLSFLEFGASIPFEIANVKWIYNIPTGSMGAVHRFENNRQIALVVSGSCEVKILHNCDIPAEESISTFRLSDPARALLIEPSETRRFTEFSTNCVLLLINSSSEQPIEI